MVIPELPGARGNTHDFCINSSARQDIPSGAHSHPEGRPMDFSVQATLGYRVQQETPFVFNVQAQTFTGQAIKSESLRIEPELMTEEWTMPESGNRYFRLIAPAGGFKIIYQATLDLSHSAEDPATVFEVSPAKLPLSVLTHLYPSRYCQSDRLDRFAQRTFGKLPMGYQRVVEVCNWIHDNVDYVSGASDALTSAYDTVSQRAGVCRDFAHLGIALCRALGVPARYVSAYAWRLEPPDFHGVFEAFLRGPSGFGWYTFDPTRMADPKGIVRIGVGRDAAEVAFCTQFGEMDYDKPEVSIVGPADAPPATTQAVRAQNG
jgi:transglutaminase-like putative cysteine protease